MKFFLFFAIFKLFAMDSISIIKNPLYEIESMVNDNTDPTDVIQTRTKLLNSIINDSDKKLDYFSELPAFIKDETLFWLKIYTALSSHEIMIHDKENLNLIYKVLSFKNIHNSKLHPYAKFNLQNKLTLNEINYIQQHLLQIKNSNKNNPTKNTLSNYKIKFSDNFKKRSTKIKGLTSNLRTQTGQSDQILMGLEEFVKHEGFLKEITSKLNLPYELLAIPLLESSFNPQARSKVDALGAWQIMPYTSNLVFPRLSETIGDYRYNTFLSSFAGLHLLKQNHSIFKRWDLAITAYNSGLKSLLKFKRKHGSSSRYNLENYLKNTKSKQIGFASKNFYAEFLALTRVIRYKNKLFLLSNKLKLQTEDLYFYTNKCSFSYKSLTKKYPRLQTYNTHIKSEVNQISERILIVSDQTIENSNFTQINNSLLYKHFPIKWINNKVKLDC